MLAGEPYLLRPWEISRLTDRQIKELYFPKRDNEGKIVPPEQDSSVMSEEDVLQMARVLGISEKRIEEIKAKADERRN